MAREPGPVFLERRSYRRRRLADAARLLPLFGAVLICIPLLWQPGAGGGDAARNAAQNATRNAAGEATGEATRTTSAMLYLFGLWLILVIASGVISARLPLGDDTRRRAGREGDAPPAAGGEGD